METNNLSKAKIDARTNVLSSIEAGNLPRSLASCRQARLRPSRDYPAIQRAFGCAGLVQIAFRKEESQRLTCTLPRSELGHGIAYISRR
jgi:hypothetical protein